ncbi:MAG TPA: hypothetical protein VN131_06835, partial [Mobilitalea sp.]|nr:hypothetical protein [Mobilitalea sp.]
DHIVDIIIGVVILFLFPLLYFGLKQDALIQSKVKIDTTEFVDDIRSKGYLTKQMYDNYLEKLSKTNLLYNITLEHNQSIYEPEYRFRTPEEIIEEQNGAFTGTNVYHYFPVSTEIPAVTDPIDNKGLTMNSETNESILANGAQTPALPGHVHDSSCYAGHVHTGNQYFVHTHAHTYSCIHYLGRVFYNVKCNSCGQTYLYLAVSYYRDPSTGQIYTMYINLSGIYNCVYCNSTNLKATQKDEYAYSCDYNIDKDGDGFYDEIPNGVAQQYIRSAPQEKRKETFTSGCYTYHESNDYSDYLKYTQYGGVILNMPEVLNMLFQSNFVGFCSIPLTYTIKYYSDDNDINSCYRYIVYNAVYSKATDTVEFRYSYYWDYSDNPWCMNPNPGFPNTLTVNQLRNLNSKAGFNDFWGKATGHYWSEGLWAITRITFTGTLSTCDYNHSQANRWVATCGQVENKTLVCSQKVKSIVPTNPVQAVYVGENLITTAIATFLDGSTKTVLCTTSFTSAVPVTNQTVTLTYTDSTSHSATCTIKVTVIPKFKKCVNGHTYNLNVDGSDPGCPFCHAWLRSLAIDHPATGSISIYRGTTLPQNGVILLAIYMDGHTEYVDKDYVDNHDKFYVGSQNVTLSYKGKNVQLIVINKRNIIQCPICHRFYELYPDDTNPGCPYCAAKTPIFTGKVMEYDDKRYTDAILNKLYDGSGIYRFNDKDYLNIKVVNRNKSWGEGLLSIVYKNLAGNNIDITYGGYIREDGQKD